MGAVVTWPNKGAGVATRRGARIDGSVRRPTAPLAAHAPHAPHAPHAATRGTTPSSSSFSSASLLRCWKHRCAARSRQTATRLAPLRTLAHRPRPLESGERPAHVTWPRVVVSCETPLRVAHRVRRAALPRRRAQLPRSLRARLGLSSHRRVGRALLSSGGGSRRLRRQWAAAAATAAAAVATAAAAGLNKERLGDAGAMATRVTKVASVVTAHAWSPDRKRALRMGLDPGHACD